MAVNVLHKGAPPRDDRRTRVRMCGKIGLRAHEVCQVCLNEAVSIKLG